MGYPVGPVGKLLIGAAAPISDQRRAVAMAFGNHPVGQFDTDIDMRGIIEAIQQEVRPLLDRRQIIARKGIFMSGGR